MPLLYQFRRSVVLWTLPLAVALAALSTRATTPFLPTYWLAASAQASSSVIVLAPLCAAAAAWQAWRFRSSGITDWAPVRGPFVVLLQWAVIPALLVTVAGLVTGLLVVAPAVAGTPGELDLRFFAVTITVVLAFTVLGYAVGGRLRPMFAVPGLLVGVLLWLVYPAALDTFWIRHITGNFYQACCSLDETVPSSAVVAPVLVAAAIGAAALIALVARRWWLGAPVAGVIIAAAIITAHTGVKDLGPNPVENRAATGPCAQKSGIAVCGWPEHARALPIAAQHLLPAVENLTTVGFTRPKRLVEWRPADGSSWQFTTSADATRQDVVASLASGLLPDTPRCAERGPWPGGSVAPVVAAWLTLKAGLTTEEVTARFGPDAGPAAAAVATHPPDKQRDWYQRNLKALTSCTQIPVGLR